MQIYTKESFTRERLIRVKYDASECQLRQYEHTVTSSDLPNTCLLVYYIVKYTPDIRLTHSR